MDKLEILAGNACFLVRNTSNEMSRNEFEDYLESEGFAKFRKYPWKDRGCFYINVNSMRYSAGVPKPAKLAGTIVGESIDNAFEIDEFKTIWNILKRIIQMPDGIDEITWGSSAFLIRNESANGFSDYLRRQNFRPLADDGYGAGAFVAVNVKSMTYSQSDMARRLISTFIGDNQACAISEEEFRTIWEIIRKHKDECCVEELLRQCEQFDDYAEVIECCDRILEIEPENAQGLYYKTLVLFDLKEYEKALDLADHAIRIHPDDYRFYNIRAFMLTDLYRIGEAIECYNNSFYLGGFDADDRNSAYRYRAICYLRKAREDFYIKKDLDESLKSLNVYLNQFPDDKDALNFKDELSCGTVSPQHTRYHEKLMYFESKAYALFELGFLKESLEAYRDVFDASQDFKDNVENTGYKWFDSITGHGTSEMDNFRWYDEVLAGCLVEFRGDYAEFFEKLFEVNEQNVSACVDKARLYSKIFMPDLAREYSKMLVEKCPQSKLAKEFNDWICGESEKRNRLSECAKFKDYKSIDEYVEDVMFCLIHSCGYTEEAAENFAQTKRDEIERDYERKYPAYDLAMDYYPVCG